MDLNARVDINYADFHVKTNCHWDLILNRFFFFILILLNIKVPFKLPAKFQQNILNHSGEKAVFYWFCYF